MAAEATTRGTCHSTNHLPVFPQEKTRACGAGFWITAAGRRPKDGDQPCAGALPVAIFDSW